MNREIQQAVEVLKRGGTILYPTDTIWGIGCDATDADAVGKVYQIKQRKDSKAMLVLVDSVDMIWDYVEEIPEAALNILEVNDQPLTIIYPGAKTGGRSGERSGDGFGERSEGRSGERSGEHSGDRSGGRSGGRDSIAELANNLVAGDGSIGIRLTTEPFSAGLIKALRKPLVSSSANTAGMAAPANFSEISEEIRNSVDHIVNWKQDDKKKRKPSGILKVSLNGEIEIIRR